MTHTIEQIHNQITDELAKLARDITASVPVDRKAVRGSLFYHRGDVSVRVTYRRVTLHVGGRRFPVKGNGTYSFDKIAAVIVERLDENQRIRDEEADIERRLAEEKAKVAPVLDRYDNSVTFRARVRTDIDGSSVNLSGLSPEQLGGVLTLIESWGDSK